MDISPNELRKDTVQLLRRIERQLNEIDVLSTSRGTISEKMMDEGGNYLLTPLLLAKAQCLHTLTLLNEQGKRPIRGEGTRR